MDIGTFISYTRRIRSTFPHEDKYLFSDSAEAIITKFCEMTSMPRSDIAFFPVYTSRASPELIFLHNRWNIIWDYHFIEIVHGFSLSALTLLLLENREPVVSENATRDAVVGSFRASLYRFLACH